MSCRLSLMRAVWWPSKVVSQARPTTLARNAHSETTGSRVSSPTGWSPPTGLPAPPGTKPALPFCVPRSKFKNLPVYTDYRNGRSQILTRVTKVDGDVATLERLLRRYLNVKNLRSRADEVTGSVTLHGNHRDKVVKWLKKMGF